MVVLSLAAKKGTKESRRNKKLHLFRLVLLWDDIATALPG